MFHFHSSRNKQIEFIVSGELRANSVFYFGSPSARWPPSKIGGIFSQMSFGENSQIHNRASVAWHTVNRLLCVHYYLQTNVNVLNRNKNKRKQTISSEKEFFHF